MPPARGKAGVVRRFTHGRVRRASLCCCVACTALVAAEVVAACGSTTQQARTTHASTTASRTVPAVKPPARSSGAALTVKGTSVVDAALDEMFPRSGADFATGIQFSEFEVAQAAKVTAACMKAQALPAPPVNHDFGGNYGTAQLPNLPVIKRTLNIGVTQGAAPPDPTKGMSKAEAAAYTGADKQCSAKPYGLLNAADKGHANALQTEWFNITDATIASKPVQSLNTKATQCAAKTAFPANSVSAETTEVEGKLTPLFIRGERAEAWATNRAGTRVFIRCFGPEINLTVQLLTKRRAAFFAQNALAVEQITADVDLGVAKLGRMAHAS